MQYYVYMLRCEGGSLYTGVTTDPERRLAQHSGEKKNGARYTAMRRPIGYERIWKAADKAAAQRLEWRIKRLTKQYKEKLVQGGRVESLSLEEYETVM